MPEQNFSFLKDKATFEPSHFQKRANINPLLKKPFAHEVSGDVRIGHVMNANIIFGLMLNEINQHTLIFGRSGSGKTNLNRVIQFEFYRNKIPFLSFDLVKFANRYIKKYIPELLILRWQKEFYKNLLEPPKGVNLDEWMMTFAEIFSEAFGLFAASKSLLIEVLKRLYEKFDSKNKKKYPTIHDLHNALEQRRKEAKSKFQRVELDYIDRIRNKTLAISLTLGKQLNVERGLSFEMLLNHYVCIELVGINSSEIQTFLVSLIMAWISAYRTANFHSSTTRHVILYDEAAHAFGKSYRDVKEPFLIGCTRRFRESGEGLILSDQSIMSLHDVMKSNIYTMICLSQSSPKDIKEAAQILGIVPPAMEPGQGIIKLAGRYVSPALLSFPYIEPQYISEEQVDELNKNDRILQDFLASVKFRENHPIKTKEKEATDNKVKEWLIAVYQHQFKKAITEIAQIIGLPNSTCSRLNKTSVNMNLVKIIQVGKSRYPILTKKAYKLIGLKEKKFFGKGAGKEHILFQHLISEKFKDLKPTIELYRGGKHIDVAFEYHDKLYAIEIELTSSHIKENIIKDIEMAKCDFVIVACKDGKVMQKAKSMISDLPNEMKTRTELFKTTELLKARADEILKGLRVDKGKF